jgi:glycosyltransferase involved in cell wall biosynthesis
MMQKDQHLVSIGLPVYNGETYLTESIESILAQTYENFELIIVDNASSDKTIDIVKSYVSKDTRIKFFQNQVNLGASANHNRTLELAKGEYFFWASYDDIRHPQYLEKCVKYLNENTLSVACHSLTKYIDETGSETDRNEVILDIANNDPIKRFKEMIRMDHKVEMILSMMRTEILKKTNGLAAFSDSDRVVMAEMCLHGPLEVLPEHLFYRREHKENSSKVYKNRQDRMAWFDPQLAGKINFPLSKQFKEYISAIFRSPISWSKKNKCLYIMLGWLVDNRKRIINEYKYGLKALIYKILLFLHIK